MTRQLEFTIEVDGTVRFVVRGAAGSECERMAEPFVGLGKLVRQRNTSEYYVENSAVDGTEVVRNTRRDAHK